MREFDQAVGQIASCCSTMGARYQGDWNTKGQHQIVIEHNGGVFTIVSNPTEGFFSCFSIRRLSNIDGFDLAESTPIVEAENKLSNIYYDIETENIKLQQVTEMVDSEGLEFFDGCQSSVPLFVYSDDFGPRQFDQSLSKVDRVCRHAFNKSLDLLDVDVDEVQDATGSERDATNRDNVAFQ